MAKIVNALTIPKLISAMKKAGFPTKKDVKDIVFNEISEFHAGITKPEMLQMEGRLNRKIDNVDVKVDKLAIEVSEVKDEVRGLKGEFASTPSRSDFETLKKNLSLA